MSKPMPARPRAAPSRSSRPREALTTTYSGQMSARQIIQGVLAAWGLVGLIVFVVSVVFFASGLQALLLGGGVGLAVAVWLLWVMVSHPTEYVLSADGLVKRLWRKGQVEEQTVALRDLGHLGYDGRSCVLRSGPRSEDCHTLIMKPEVMEAFWARLLQLREAVGEEPPYSRHQGPDMWWADPYLLERDPERLSGRLRIIGTGSSEQEVDQGEGTAVRFSLRREATHYWLVMREGESRPRLGIRDWSVQGSASTFDVFDWRGVHVARLRGLRDVVVEIDSRRLRFTQEGSREVVREEEQVLLEFVEGEVPGIVLRRPLPQALVELLVLAREAPRRAARSD